MIGAMAEWSCAASLSRRDLTMKGSAGQQGERRATEVLVQSKVLRLTLPFARGDDQR